MKNLNLETFFVVYGQTFQRDEAYDLDISKFLPIVVIVSWKYN